MDAPSTLPATITPPNDAAKAKDVGENKDLAALSYAWVLSVVILLIRGGKSPFIAFHAKQGTAFFLLSIVLWIVPVVGRLLELFVLAGVIYGFMNAAQGKWTLVPIVGPLASGDMHGVRQDWHRVVQLVTHLWSTVVTRKPATPETPAAPATGPAKKEEPASPPHP